MNNTENPDNKGKLYIVSTPIGNKDDITLRAINTIKRCDIIVCEEMKMGALTLKNLNLAKELIPLNENNESDMTMEVLNLLKAGKKIALISDAGTPVFADPGLYLVRTAISNNIEMEVVPGVSSIMTAIVRSGFDIYEFLYAGFLPRKNEDRDRKIQRLARERRTVVILETPYRLNTLLSACAEILPDRRVYLGMNLTMPFETHHYGTFAELVKKFENSKIKSEFVLIMEGNKEWIGPKKVEISDDYYDDDDDDDDDDGPVEYEYPVKAHIKPPVSTNRKIISDKSRFKKSTDSRTGSYSGAKKPGSGFSRGSSSGSRDYNSSSPRKTYGGESGGSSEFRKSPSRDYNSSSPRKSYGGESGGSSEFRKSPDRDFKSSSPRKSYGGESGGSSEFRKSPDRDFKSSSPRKSYGGESGGSSEFRKSSDRDFKSSSPRKSYGGESGGSSEFRKSPDRDYKSSSPRKSYGGESGGSSEFRKSPDRDFKSSSPRKSYGGESGGSSEFRKSPDRDFKSSSPRKSYGGESEGGFSGVKRTPKKTISRGRPSKGGFSKK